MADKWTLPGQCAFRLIMNLHRWQLFVAFGCIVWCMVEPCAAQGNRCAYKVTRPENQTSHTKAGNVSGSEQICTNTSCCMAYYRLVNGTPVLDVMACSVVEKSCPNAICQGSPRASGVMIRCVCNSDLCNAQLTWSPADNDKSPADNETVAFIVIPVILFLVLCIMGFVAVTCRRHTLKPMFKGNDLHNVSLESLESSKIDCADIELQQIVGHGSFATVWQGKYQGSLVAVKVFPAARKREFTTEKDIYELPLLNHAGIVHFLGAGSKLEGGEWMIVLELAAKGSLHSFLSEMTSDWVSSLKLSQSLTQGLAYLHSGLYRQGGHKPAVAHRDLSSANVLVRADGSCALCDFGLSTAMGPWQCHLDTTALHQKGTFRYMPPEILEGSVHLSRGRTQICCFLQADMYALGLLLWEIWMRCSDLFEGSPVPHHYMPYEAELGASVMLNQLIQYVCQMGNRPSIPPHWEESAQGIALQEIMTDCWDPDPQARLQAQCVVDRLFRLNPLEYEKTDGHFVF